MIDFIKNHKLLCFVLFLNVTIILVLILVVIRHQSKTATVDILVAPSAATIELNGREYENQMSHDVIPGEYHVKISMEGMNTKEFEIELEENGFSRINTYLLDDKGGFSYYVEHPDDMTVLEDVADADARRFLEDYSKLHKFSEMLPLVYSNTFDEKANEIISISIEWGTGNACHDRYYCLVVHDYTGKNQERALDMIREKGYNPDDFEIIYKTGGD